MTTSMTPLTKLESTSGTTWHLWQTDRCDALPLETLGPPADGDGQADRRRASGRRSRFGGDAAARLPAIR